MSKEKRIDLFKILKNERKLTKIKVYPTFTTLDDPYEKNRTQKFLNPIYIDAFVRDVSIEALHWKYYGNIPISSKEIQCEKKYKSLLLNSRRIMIGDDYYKCYHDGSKGFAIKERKDYITAILEKSNE